MKNKLLLLGILGISFVILVGCQKSGGNGAVGEVDDEWFAAAEGYCEDEGGEIEVWEEGDGYQPVCFYEEDESFCYLEDLYDGSCNKGELYYRDNLYPYAEQACLDSNGQISQTEDGEDICILSDDEFCYMSDIADGACDLLKYDVQDVYDNHAEEKAYQEYVAECYNQPQDTVCGQDGNEYYNRCFMEKAGIEEEIELAEVVDGKCIYG